MKHLILGFAIAALTSTAFARLPKAIDKDHDTIYTNTVEYTRRGSLGSMDYVVTEVPTTNLVTKGINSWVETDDSDGDVDGIFGFGVTYKPNGDISIADPVSGEFVRSAYYMTQEGHSFISSGTESAEGFTYFCQGQNRNVSNVPFVYGTNSTNSAECKQIILPNKASTDDDQILKQNSKEIFADRAWVIAILKAYKDGKLTFNDDDSITIAP